MPQFTVSLDTFGNVRVESGVVIDITGYSPVIHRFKNSNSYAISPDLMGATRWDPKFCGGSGRNIYVEPTPSNSSVPSGFYSLAEDYKWYPENENQFLWTIDPSTLQIQFKDNDGNVIAESAGGAFDPYGKIACSSALVNGSQGSYYYEVDLGTATGTVTLNYDAYSVPDRFIVSYDGSDVIDTGIVGDSGTYTDIDGNSVYVTVAGPGAGTISFNKSNAYPRTAILKVIAPYMGTAWECNLGCPGGSSPPFGPISSSDYIKVPFTAPTTSFGTTLFGGAVTINATYEGNKSKGFVDPTTLAIIKQRRTTVKFQSEASGIGISSDFATEWDEEKFQLWSNLESNIVFRTLSDGSAEIYDGTDVIATRPIGLILDCSGGYTSTEYGAVTYNDNQSFLTNVVMNRNSPMQDMIVFMAINRYAGSITSIEGPFLDFLIPDTTTTKVYIPLAMVHPNSTIDQLSEGSIIWK